MDAEIPRILTAFIDIAGVKEWRRRLISLDKQLANNEFLRAYIEQIYALELEVGRVLK